MGTFYRLFYIIALGIIVPACGSILRAQEPHLRVSAGTVFTENRGQVLGTDESARKDVLFTARSGGAQIYLRAEGMSCVFARLDRMQRESDEGTHGHDDEDVAATLYRMDIDLVGCNPSASVEVEEQEPGHMNFYPAHAPEGIVGVRSYRRVIYRDVYPNIDLIFHARPDGLKYDFVVHPGGRVSDIRMRYVGADPIELHDGGLRAAAPLGELTDDPPYTYQEESSGDTVTIASRYELADDVIGFGVDAYDSSRTLVIDPTRLWSTYYGGGLDENVLGGRTISLDGSNDVYMVGQTFSTNFPVTTGAYQTTNAGNRDGFLVRFNSSGVRQWATYFGGTSWELAHGVVIDAGGNITVGGHTESGNFPVTTSAYQTTYGGTRDGFVIQFNSAGARLWATYYGGTASEDVYGVALDGNDNIIVVGATKATGTGLSTTTGAFQTTGGGDWDAFAVKFGSGGARHWATYYGGTKMDYAYAVAVDSRDAVYMTGWTKSTDFPIVMSGFQPTCGGCPTYYDTYVVKFDSGGSRQWATYYGGSLSENYDGAGDGSSAITVDGNDHVIVTGFTKSSDLPVSVGAHQGARAGTNVNQDAYIIKFDSSGGRIWSTYYGGGGDDDCLGVSTDTDNNVVITGGTLSTNFPVTTRAYQATNSGMNDAYIAKFDSSGARVWATYYGGSDVDYGSDIVAEGNDYIYVSGVTKSTGFPVSSGAQQTTCGGCGTYYDAFVAKFCLYEFTPVVTVDGPLAFCSGESVTLTAPEGFDGYRWSNNATTRAITVTQGGNYTVVVTDAAGCTGTSDTIKVTVYPPVLVDAGSDGAVCLGESIRIGGAPSARNGAGVYRYQWTPSDGLNDAAIPNPFARPSVTTIYRLTVVDTNGCSAYDSVTVLVYPVPSADAGVDMTVCEGSLIRLGGTATGAGGTAPYAYTWSSPNDPLFKPSAEEQPRVIPTASADYIVVVTDANGCRARDTLHVTVHPRPIVDAGGDITLCVGDSVVIGGAIPVEGGTPPYTLWWEPSKGLSSTIIDHPVARPTTTTRYLLTVVDANGCVDSSSILVNVNERPVADAGADTTICYGAAVRLGAMTPTNPGNYRYRWTPPTGLSTPDKPHPLASPTQTTVYTVSVIDPNGCESIDSVRIAVQPQLIVDAGTNAEMCEAGTVVIGRSAAAVGGAPPYKYEWSPSLGLSSPLSPTTSAAPSATTLYQLTVTDAFGCVAVDTVLVTVNPKPRVDAGRPVEICYGEAARIGGDSTAAGTGPFVYSWFPVDGLNSATVPNPLASPKETTTYMVEVTDANGCSAIDSVRVVVYPKLDLDAGPDERICADVPLVIGGYAVISGGTPPYRYAWYPSTWLSDSTVLSPTALPLSTMAYRLTVTDANGCSVSDSMTVTVHPRPVAAITADGPLSFCKGGVLRLRSVGTFAAYLWSTGESTPSIVTKKDGFYTLTVTDSNGCVATSDPVKVVEISLPDARIVGPAAACSDATVNYAVAGLPSVDYQWSVSSGGRIVAGQGSATISVQWTSIGAQEVAVTATNMVTGCVIASEPYRVSVAPTLLPTVTAEGSTTLCAGDSVTLDAGAGYDRYLWSTGDRTRRITVNAPGVYSVTTSLNGGCSGVSSPVTVIVRSTSKPEPRLRVDKSSALCAGDSITLDAGMGASYLWSTGASTRSITVGTAGAYFVAVSNADGCVGYSDTVQVDFAPAPVPSIIASGDLSFCKGGSVTLSAPGGFVEYRWSTGEIGQRITVQDSGDYWVEVTGANGCVGRSAPASVRIDLPPMPVVDGPTSVCYNRVATYKKTTPSSNPCHWEVTNGQLLSGQGSDSITVQWGYQGPGRIVMRETDGRTGCEGISPTFTVTIDAELRPIIRAASGTALCEGDSITLDAGDGYDSYEWSNGKTTRVITVIEPGLYSVRVGYSGGCDGTSNSVRVIMYPRPTPVIAALGPTEFCRGDSVTLEADPGRAEYLWSNGATTRSIVAREPGLYSVRVRNGEGCWGASTGIPVIVHAKSQIDISVDRPDALSTEILELVDGDTVRLTATPGFFAYLWSNGESSQSIVVDRAGEYSVAALDINGCDARSSVMKVTVIKAATAVVALPMVEARPGERFQVALEAREMINLHRSRRTLSADGRVRFETDIRFDKTMLLPVGSTPTGRIDGNDRIVTVSGWVADTARTLATLEFMAALGGAESTPLRFDRFVWDDPVVRTTTVDGEFRLTGVCPAGGRRLFRADGRVGLKPASPNPASGPAEIVYETVEPGRTKLAIVDALGNEVATLVDEDHFPGAYAVRFDASRLPSGSYFCVLRTPTQRLSRALEIVR